MRIEPYVRCYMCSISMNTRIIITNEKIHSSDILKYFQGRSI